MPLRIQGQPVHALDPQAHHREVRALAARTVERRFGLALALALALALDIAIGLRAGVVAGSAGGVAVRSLIARAPFFSGDRGVLVGVKGDRDRGVPSAARRRSRRRRP